MSIAFLFPGQGSQHAGMLHSLPEHPVVANTLADISESLGQDVQSLDSEHALQSTTSVQLCIFTAGVAVGRTLISLGVQPYAVAGLSVGAFAAAVTCGALDLRDGLSLVRQRAEMMQQLFARGYGMAAIVGLNQSQVESLVATVSTSENPVYVANINAEREIVIAGIDAGLDSAISLANKCGARKAERLNLTVPSHCPLLTTVSVSLQTSLQSMTLKQPESIYISNVAARPLRKANDIAADLAKSIAQSVHWYAGNELLKELGCTLFLEMHPGHVLTDLARQNVPEVRAESLATSSLRQAQKLAAQVKV